ncbi:adenylate/guanylate cyclase domain-containing protein [Flagellimonas algicola]|uniref:Adenylate/guanylate cyclase domain-containing protein n=1 Tax=Flagellimonas algicola TaxID=2583815 RepID=A0ABY2WQ05_9FLAO|nr:adenylate/guanylate cyclase domain-containing protein [Allomuricauda algicola]TMU56993.1 adenylate/guanylate cyclase domain-containing protein [Allomuricauda algicola]
MLHPRYLRYAKQALFFAFIWLLFGIVYSLLEQGILGRSSFYPSTQNRYDFKSSLLYATTGSFLIGLIHGWLEVSWLSQKFYNKALWVKVVLKSGFYLIFMFLFLTFFTLAINSYRFDASPMSKEVMYGFESFFTTFSFWSVFIYIAFGLVTAMLFAELASYLGPNVFLNFLFGKYHTPKQETRIFMFMDMRSSTTIAEKIGHTKYFELLKDCYADMGNAILETSGEIYQYVGDEIVVTWPEKVGLYRNNWAECFFRITRLFETRNGYYSNKYGSVPFFKAGFHLGLVTTGEIGTLKKEIIYTGDVLNTTARIQAECNTYGKSNLVSEQLIQKMNSKDSLQFTKIAKLHLRGKKELVQLYTLDQSSKTNSI